MKQRIVYYVGPEMAAKLTLTPQANLKQVDALMARDGIKRVSKEEWIAAKAKIDQEKETVTE